MNGELEKFADQIRQNPELKSSFVAKQTVKLLRGMVSEEEKWKNANELMKLIRNESKKLLFCSPSQTVIGNIVKRILKMIREAYDQEVGEEIENQGYEKQIAKLKDRIMDSISDLLEELEQSVHSIACEAVNHIHMNEVVMTIGKSKTVEQFLKAAAKNRRFHVIVAECAPFYHGQQLATSLAKSKIETTVIPDSAIFALMSRVNKVIIGTQAVLANGGLKAVCGSYSMALAAQNYSVPLIVCTALYKLSPQFLCSVDKGAFAEFASPEDVLGLWNVGNASSTQIYNPVFDYVPPELVKLFIFNNGGNAPSYIYRLLSELYHPDDHNLENEI